MLEAAANAMSAASEGHHLHAVLRCCASLILLAPVLRESGLTGVLKVEQMLINVPPVYRVVDQAARQAGVLALFVLLGMHQDGRDLLERLNSEHDKEHLQQVAYSFVELMRLLGR